MVVHTQNHPFINHDNLFTTRAQRKKWNPLTPTRLVGWLLLVAGLIVLASFIIFESLILVFIGLGLTFWGPLLFFATTEKLVKQCLLDSAVIPTLRNLNEILTELKYQGGGIYLSPEYLKDFETSKIFISKGRYANLPSPARA